MTDTRFAYDAFVSYSSANFRRAEHLARRLRRDGLRVWFDRWVINPGMSIPIAVEEGLQASRTLIFLMSLASLGSEWASVERHTVLFRHPMNRERRFVPVLIDHCEHRIPELLRTYRHIDMCRFTKQAYEELLTACRAPNSGVKESENPGSVTPPAGPPTIHHFDDEPGMVSWIPDALWDAWVLSHPEAATSQEPQWDQLGLEASLPIPTATGARLLSYRIYPDTHSFGAAARWRIRPSDIVILDIMAEDASGTFLNVGIEALELVSARVPPENIFLLTGFPRGITNRAVGLIAAENVFTKPVDAHALVTALLQRLGLA